MSSTPAFRIVPLPAAVADRARQTLTDACGHRLSPRVNHAPHAFPCRRTLRMIRPREEMLLLSHSPFQLDHPYRKTRPIVISRHAADAYSDIHRWPPEIDPTNRVFRAYNAAEEIVDARVGIAKPERLIAELFARTNVACMHVRSLTHGCFIFKIARP